MKPSNSRKQRPHPRSARSAQGLRGRRRWHPRIAVRHHRAGCQDQGARALGDEGVGEALSLPQAPGCPVDRLEPVLFLVHGSTFSSRGSYDLRVPGRTGYSAMDHFAGLGYDVWTMDHEGYGFSSRTSGNSGIQTGVDDLRAALPVVEKVTGKSAVLMFGESSGAIRASAFAVAEPNRVERLVLHAFTYTGENAPRSSAAASRRISIVPIRAGRLASPRFRTSSIATSPAKLIPRWSKRSPITSCNSATVCRAAPISTWPSTCRWWILPVSIARRASCAPSMMATPATKSSTASFARSPPRTNRSCSCRA